MTNVIVAITIALYMTAMVGIGIFFTKRNRSTDDFYLGGRQLGPWVTAMSAEASDMSSWLLMGLPGVALAGLVGMNGSFVEAIWTAIGLAFGTYINWLIVAKRIRLYSEQISAFTIPDFYSNRYDDKKGILLIISAMIIIVFFVPYTASGFASVGKLFNSTFGVDYHLAMVVGAIVISLYTITGGFLAASTTDFVQSIVMTIALLVVIGYGVQNAGSFNTVMENANAVDGYFSFEKKGDYGTLSIVSTMAWGLGYFGMPHILLRFMAIHDEDKLKTSRRIATVWVIISMGAAVLIGIVGYSYVLNSGLLENKDFDPERIIIYISSAISVVNPLFAIIAGLILSGILASVMSTADSQMLAASSSVSENLVGRFVFKGGNDRKRIMVARLTVCAIAFVSAFFAWDANNSVFRIISFAWAGFGASFGPLTLFSLLWRRTNLYGAVAGILGGGIMVFLWKFWISNLGGIFDIYELLPGFLFSSALIFIVSLMTKPPSKKIIEDFDEVKRMSKDS